MKNSNQTIEFFETYICFTPDSEEYTEKQVVEFLEYLQELYIYSWETTSETTDFGFGQSTKCEIGFTKEQLEELNINPNEQCEFDEWFQKEWEFRFPNNPY